MLYHRPAATLLAALALAACGGPSPGPVPARPPADPGFVSVGDYELRYGTVNPADIPREVAASYGLERRAGVLVLSVTVLRREEGQLPAPVDATVTGSQRNLIGAPIALAFRRLNVGGSPSWVAEVDPTAPGIVQIDIEAEPADGGPRLSASLQRDFPTR